MTEKTMGQSPGGGPGTARRAPGALAAIVSGALFFFSCGIDAYYYLPEVPAGNITTSANQWADINLPGNAPPYFTHFVLYYRIYLSRESQANMGNLGSVNSSLDSDYRYFSSYTNAAASTSGVNVSSIMSGRNYQPLFFEAGGVISNDLINTPGGSLRIEFPFAAGSDPFAIIYPGGGRAELRRSNGDGAFNPLPDRSFFNSSQLRDPVNINSTTNADVVNAGGFGDPPYAYAALYIAGAGVNEQSYTPIFSIPTFVGIFRLPD
jgi:hypothetical protein